MEVITEEDLKKYAVVRKEYERLMNDLFTIYRRHFNKSRRYFNRMVAKYSATLTPANRQPVLSFPEILAQIDVRATDLWIEAQSLDEWLKKFDKPMLELTLIERNYVNYRYMQGYRHLDCATLLGYEKGGMDKVRVRALEKLGIREKE